MSKTQFLVMQKSFGQRNKLSKPRLYLDNDFTTLRNGADIAVLMTEGGAGLGASMFNSITSKQTLAVVDRRGALGYYQFGYEIARMYGAFNNREAGTNPAYNYAYAYRFNPPLSSTIFGTILA